jgi:hypothetical protein
MTREYEITFEGLDAVGCSALIVRHFIVLVLCARRGMLSVQAERNPVTMVVSIAQSVLSLEINSVPEVPPCGLLVFEPASAQGITHNFGA